MSIANVGNHYTTSTCHLEDVVVPVDHRVKIKERKNDTIQNWKVAVYEGNVDSCRIYSLRITTEYIGIKLLFDFVWLAFMVRQPL